MLDVLAGNVPVDDVRIVTPPSPPAIQPRAAGKAIYGQNLAFHQETDNFTLQWSDAAVDADLAVAIGEELEAAWPYFSAHGWVPPVSSDAYLLWVVLDRTLSGTGLTTIYTDDAFPEGYPVMYVNPDYDPGFVPHVAVHELNHAFQFAVRDWSYDDEAWFWEATAEWGTELSRPSLDWYAYSSEWYAQAPELPADSLTDYHQYGMFLLPAYLTQYEIGEDGLRQIWEDAGSEEWPDAIAAVGGRDFGSLVADMAGAVGAGALRESVLYAEPETTGELELPGLYGSIYVPVEDAMAIAPEGPILTRWAVDGEWSEVPPEGEALMVITAVAEDGEIVDGNYVSGVPPEAEGVACGCASGGSMGLGAVAVVTAWISGRSRTTRVTRERKEGRKGGGNTTEITERAEGDEGGRKHHRDHRARRGDEGGR